MAGHSAEGFLLGPFRVSYSDPCSEIHTIEINYAIAVVTDYVALCYIKYYVSSLLWTCVSGSNKDFLLLLLKQPQWVNLTHHTQE